MGRPRGAGHSQHRHDVDARGDSRGGGTSRQGGWRFVVSLILAIWGTASAGCIWGIICNQRTFEQKKAMLMLAPPGHPLCWEILDECKRVTYAQHFWMLFFLL